MKKVLFIVKCRGMSYERTDDSVRVTGTPGTPGFCLSSGLFNSANFVNKMLNRHSVMSKIVQVIDNNCIDREVTAFQPTHVVIEALWVVPEKFEVLKRLHPHVTWIIRLHSDVPFIAGEGNSMSWVLEYLKYTNVLIAPNTKRMMRDMFTLTKAAYGERIARTKLIYLPNYYEMVGVQRVSKPNRKNVVDIGCFGAIRPLKNQLIQALAAIEYATQVGKKLRYHINVGRVEHGNNTLKNIRAIFDALDPTKFELVEHMWMPHHKFVEVVRQMDVCLQVSFSETFNIVTADAVSQGIPVVTSDEISWTFPLFHATTTSRTDIVRTIHRAMQMKNLGSFMNYLGLLWYNKKAIKVWMKRFRK